MVPGAVGTATSVSGADAGSLAQDGGGESFDLTTGPVDATSDRLQETRVEIRNNNTYFRGQTLFTELFTASDSPVELLAPQRDNPFVSQLAVNEDGEVVVNTDQFAAGNYVIRDDEGTRVYFHLANQKLNVTNVDLSFPNGGGRASSILLVTSNRASFDMTVDVREMSDENLSAVLNGTDLQDADGDGDREAVVGVTGTSKDLQVDFSGIRPGEYTFELGTTDTLVSTTVNVTVTPYPAGTINFGNDVRLQPIRGERVGATTTLPDDTAVTVVVSGDTFRRSRTVEVNDGRISARVDLQNAAVGTDVEVRAIVNGYTRASTTASVVEAASITVPDQTVPDRQSVGIERVVVPNGGYVVVTNLDDEVLGASEYLDPGAHEDVTVSLDDSLDDGLTEVVVRVHRDTNGNQQFDFGGGNVDGPYLIDRQSVSAFAELTVPVTTTPTTSTSTPTTTTSTPTPTISTSTPTTSPPTTSTPTTSPPTTSTTTDDGDGGGQGLPGFGVWAALVAVLAALIALRRRR